jgi:hypothetical protein
MKSQIVFFLKSYDLLLLYISNYALDHININYVVVIS